MNALLPPHCGRIRLFVTGLLVVLFASACASNSELVLSKLDPRTSVTISYNPAPLVFYRSGSEKSSNTNEQIYLAPLEVNRSGDYRYYVWLATWAESDFSRYDLRQNRLESIDIIADGQQLTLKMTGASARAIGASEPVYRKPVSWANEAYYDVTLDQLRRIAEAKDLSVQYSSTQETFRPWDNRESNKEGLFAFLVHSEF